MKQGSAESAYSGQVIRFFHLSYCVKWLIIGKELLPEILALTLY